MRTNALPAYDASDNSTSCCPRFNPDGWDGRNLHFEDKLFVRATTDSVDYVPTNMGSVLENTFAAIQKAGAFDPNDIVVLSRDLSPSQGEHYFSVSKPVPGLDTIRWTGDYVTKVFEGPYEDSRTWAKQLGTELAQRGQKASRTYFFYTTCPKCSQTYGKNYVVAFAELADDRKTVN